MEERITAPVAAMLVVAPPSGLPAPHPVAATIEDSTQLLDVNVHQLTGRGHHVSDRGGPAYRQHVRLSIWLSIMYRDAGVRLGSTVGAPH